MSRGARGAGPARVTLRTHRRRILAWTLPLLGLLAVVAPSYNSTYPSLDQREHLIDGLADNAATRLLYGPLPRPGTIGQLVAWEMGTYLVIVSSVMALLLGVSFGRGAEESGVAEVVQACGQPVTARLRGGLVSMITVTGGLGVAVAVVLWVQTAFIAELTWRGAFGLGLVTACCSLFFGLTGLLAGELADSSGLARLLGFVTLAAAFALRAVANVQGVTALRWVSPLGWLDVESPYTDDVFWAGVVFAAVCVGMAVLVWIVGRDREFAAAPLHERTTSTDRLRVRAVLGLDWHLERGRWVAWAVIVTALGALFGAMSGSMLDLIGGDAATAKLMRQMTGEQQLDAVYFSFIGVMLAILVACYAVATVLADAAAEADGTLENVLTCGSPRRAPLASRVTIAVVGSCVMLLLAGGVAALVTIGQLSGSAGRCFAFVVGQAPAILALTGIGALLVGAVRRWSAIAWVPLVGSAVLVLMGSVLHAPDWLERAGVFAHVPDYVDGASPSTGAVVLLVCFVAAAAIGTWRRGRRDLVTG